MRKNWIAMGGMLMLAGCGGSDGSSGGVAVVSGSATPTPTPTPTPTATPTPTPTATPTPSSSYTRYADLTGDRTFQTACASLVLGSGLPTPQPALPFGEALALGYTAASAAWSVSGDGVSQTFVAGDAVSAPTGQRIYNHTVSGSVQQLAIIDPVVSGTTLSYTRGFALRVDRSAGTTLYSCVFGVPALTTDVPVANAVSYAGATVAGTAYVNANGTIQTYLLTNSVATLRYDPATASMIVSIQLTGNLQTGSTVSTTATDLGTFTSSAAVTASRSRFAGSLDSANRISQFSSLTGAFFGNTEAGLAFEVLAVDPATGNRLAATGTVAAR